MDNKNVESQKYIRAKKRIKEIKGFYSHLVSYIVINLFISGVIIFGLTNDGYSFPGVLTNFGVYSVWLFWGIGIFFHWLGVFGFRSLAFGKDWEDRKIKEFMDRDTNQERRLTKK
ncbi:MAG: 2TM domain-containing protein [Polaribacter sp.]